MSRCCCSKQDLPTGARSFTCRLPRATLSTPADSTGATRASPSLTWAGGGSGSAGACAGRIGEHQRTGVPARPCARLRRMGRGGRGGMGLRRRPALLSEARNTGGPLEPLPGRQVVDPECRVHGVEGLRVADASIMPLIPSCNLNCPAFMIGEKAADLIAGRPPLPLSNLPYFVVQEWKMRQR